MPDRDDSTTAAPPQKRKARAALYAQFDCEFPDRPDVAEAGDLAELVYMRTVLRCRRYLTDGVVDHRVLTRWYAGIRGKVETHLSRLVAVGLLETHPDGWRIPLDVWSAWNPTKEEVQVKRDSEAERLRQVRAKKKEANAERTDVRGAYDDRTYGVRTGQSETQSKTETETQSKSSSPDPVHNSEPAPASRPDDDPIGTIIDAIIAARTAGRTVTDPIAHLRACRANFAAKERLGLDMMLAARPHFLTAEPGMVAQFYLASSYAKGAA